MQSSESARTVWLASRNEHRIVSWPFHRLLRLLRAPQGRFPSTTRKSPVSHYDKDESVTPSELISNLQGYVIHAIPSVGPLAHREEQETFNLKVLGSRPRRPTEVLIKGSLLSLARESLANGLATAS